MVGGDEFPPNSGQNAIVSICLVAASMSSRLPYPTFTHHMAAGPSIIVRPSLSTTSAPCAETATTGPSAASCRGRARGWTTCAKSFVARSSPSA